MPALPVTIDGVTFSTSGPGKNTNLRSTNVRCTTCNPPSGDPRGSFDHVSAPEPGRVRVAGWAQDPNNTGAQIRVHAYVGGPAGAAGAEGHDLGPASNCRSDVGCHGFDKTVTTGKVGTHDVYVYAINHPGTPGNNKLLGKRTVTIADPSPRGALDKASSPEPGKVRIVGWALDPSDEDAFVDIHAYVGGPAGDPDAHGRDLGAAGKCRADVGCHGFNKTFNTPKRGTHEVYVYAINLSGTPGGHRLIGTQTVTIAEASPVGELERASSPAPRQIRIRGWAEDPSDPDVPVEIRAYVGGSAADPDAQQRDLGLAAVCRNDVGCHGFDKTFNTSKQGTQKVWVYALDLPGTPGQDVLIGTLVVDIVSPSPKGVVEKATSPEPGQIRIRGWARDPDNSEEPIEIVVSVGGPLGDADAQRRDLGLAADCRSDVGCHGFNKTFNTAKRGLTVVWVYAKNLPGTRGSDTLIGRRSVTVEPPVRHVADQVGLVDPSQGRWYLRDADGQVTSFFFGNPGDVPVTGDWDCNGTDTPGLYRRADGYVYLSNANRSQNADIRFFFGNPGDLPLAGDFDGDGCDTISIYRPSEGRIFIINQLGANDGGLGAAETSYYFGNPGDQPFVGDFDADGTDTVGLHRASTGLVYFNNHHRSQPADRQFIFGDPGDRLVAGDWTADGTSSPALFRPTTRTFYFRHTNTQGNADHQLRWGQPNWHPIAGTWN